MSVGVVTHTLIYGNEYVLYSDLSYLSKITATCWYDSSQNLELEYSYCSTPVPHNPSSGCSSRGLQYDGTFPILHEIWLEYYVIVPVADCDSLRRMQTYCDVSCVCKRICMFFIIDNCGATTLSRHQHATRGPVCIGI
jgi:hypothetical protein